MRKKTSKSKKQKGPVKPCPIFRDLPMRDKVEAILSWNVNGGVYRGRKLTRSQLATFLSIKVSEIDALIETAFSNLVSAYSNSSSIRQQVLSVVAKLFYQYQEDRGRTIAHLDFLDDELRQAKVRLDAAHKSKSKDKNQQNINRYLIMDGNAQIRSLSRRYIEAMEMSVQLNVGLTKVLALFSGGGKGGKGDGAFGLEDAPSDKRKDLVTFDKLIHVLEDSGERILPSQDLKVNTGPRNPNTGFEEFESQKPEFLEEFAK